MILFYGCNSQGQDQGIIKIHTYFFGLDSLTTIPPLDISYRILFKKNRSIQEVPLIISSEDSSGEKTLVKIKHYSYLNPDENVCYNYRELSDTAEVLENYSDIDSVSKSGGWNFYSNRKFEYNSSKNLSDTVINNFTYGRIKLDKKINDISGYLIIYFRCDKKGTLIKIFKPLSDSIGCPIFRDDSFIKNKLFMTRELEFISDKLSPYELKIFEAWERNEKQNPAKK